MTWKYLNPGDYRLLPYRASGAKNYTDSGGLMAPETKRLFLGNSSESSLRNLALQKLWGACTVFVQTGGYDSITIRNTNEDSLILYCYPTYLRVYCSWCSQTYQKNFTESAHNFRVWFHIESSATDGVIEIYINNEPLVNWSNINVLRGSNISTIHFSTFTSDIILSDEPVDINEHCAFLPVKQTTADGWYYDDANANYKADSAGQTIWQTPDVTQLQTAIGLTNPTITAVGSYARGVATNDSSVVDALTLKVRQGNDTVDAETKAIDSTTVFLPSAITVNPITGAAWSLQDLNSLEFGIASAKT